MLITDAVDPVCRHLLEERGYTVDLQTGRTAEELVDLARQADAWIIRSGTQVTAAMIEASDRLMVIGRAGVGVDNVDLEAATRRGVLVINAPDGNTLSTAEHTCAMLLALARHIPQANATLREGRWERNAFSGAELYEKTLGIVGFGKIGREVGRRMGAFGMKVLAYDPVVSDEAVERAGATPATFEVLCRRSDYITVHTPLNDATRRLFCRETLAQCRRGVRVVNCARGGIIDEADLLEALEEGRVGGAALDVFTSEPPQARLAPLLNHPAVVATPHLAASTGEAQARVARQVTEQVIHALSGEPVSTPVNAMAIKMAGRQEVQPFLHLARALGRLAAPLAGDQLREVCVRCHGEVPHRYADVLLLAVIEALLPRWVDQPVNLINAPYLAEEMGLALVEERHSTAVDYANLIEVQLASAGDVHVVAGTVFAPAEPRIVRIDGYHLEVRPEGCYLLYTNQDRPGVLAAVGGILAEASVNIASLALGRKERGDLALTMIGVDEGPPASVLDRITGLSGIQHVRLLHFGGG